jgi:hypothetical protein
MLNFKKLVPFAILTYILFMLALLIGMRVIKVPIKAHRRVHQVVALFAMVLATFHAIIMIYITYFL